MTGPTSEQLATLMVHTLPGWGLWATDVRDFQTPFGSIGFRQASILWVLRYEELPESERTPTGLARHFGVQNSAITRAVDKLVAGGFVTRMAAPHDRRVQILTITETGQQISVFIEQLYTAPLQGVLEELGEDERSRLSEQLDVLFGVLQRIRDLPVS